MWAEFFQPHVPDRAGAVPALAPETHSRVRSIHRVIALIFTATVAANFLAMAWGSPPPWITYAPLGPLIVLMATGLYMLVTRYVWRSRQGGPKHG